MKAKTIFLLLFFVCNTNFVYADNSREILEIFRNTRCITCEGQSIEDSNSAFAKDLKRKIQKKIREGNSKQAIYDDLREEYGEKIFFTPPDSGKKLIILAAIIFVLFIFFLCT